MKINELLIDFEIFLSNAEKAVLESMDGTRMLTDYGERDQFHIENLIRKSLVSKVHTKNGTLVQRNVRQPS